MNDWNIREIEETQENSGAETSNSQDEKLFSQEELNRIIGERLAKERRQITENLAIREAEIQEKEFRMEAMKMLELSGFDFEIMKFLNCRSLLELEEAIGILTEQVMRSLNIHKEKLEERAKTVSLIPPMGDFSANDEGMKLRRAMGIE